MLNTDYYRHDILQISTSRSARTREPWPGCSLPVQSLRNARGAISVGYLEKKNPIATSGAKLIICTCTQHGVKTWRIFEYFSNFLNRFLNFFHHKKIALFKQNITKLLQLAKLLNYFFVYFSNKTSEFKKKVTDWKVRQKFTERNHTRIAKNSLIIAVCNHWNRCSLRSTWFTYNLRETNLSHHSMIFAVPLKIVL